jgi:hypothetical protein
MSSQAHSQRGTLLFVLMLRSHLVKTKELFFMLSAPFFEVAEWTAGWAEFHDGES